MRECQRVSELFWDLHDGRLDSETEKSVQDHFHRCTGCREEFKWYRVTVQALGNLDPVTPPRDFVAQLNLRLQNSSPSSAYIEFFRNLFSRSPYMPLPVGVAALALIVVVGYAAYNHAPISIPGTPGAPAYEASTVPGVAPRGLAGGPGGMLAKHASPDTLPPRHPDPSSSLASAAKLLEQNLQSGAQPYAMVHDQLDAENLTVESPRIEEAVASFKRKLPDIQGRLVSEANRGTQDGVVIRVLIPSYSYGNLTTELVNHGAVEAGGGVEASVAAPSKKEDNSMYLRIHFVRSR